MSSSYLKDQSARETPQRQQIDVDQIANSEGGFVFGLDSFGRFARWLVLGSEGGSFYAEQRDLTSQNVKALDECLKADPARTIKMIVDVSTGGQAPRNTEAIFALAVAASVDDVETRRAALKALPDVCRTGTHLFQFADFVEGQRGWGRSLRRAVAQWYAGKDADDLAYGLVKYRQREGWRHRDLLRLSHPANFGKGTSGNPEVTVSDAHARLFDWVVKAGFDRPITQSIVSAPDAVEAFTLAQASESPEQTAKLIGQYGNKLPREAIKSEHLNSAQVWDALLRQRMPMTALIRNLANLTRSGVVRPMSDGAKLVTDQIADVEALRAARVHPLSILIAMTTYQSGRGQRGGNEWEPVQSVVDALDAAFYAAFDNVQPTGKRHLLALDISLSMNHAISNTNLTCMAGALAMSMVTDRAEPQTHVFGFDDGFRDLNISSRSRLDQVLAALPRNYGGTDCSLPMLYALEKGIEVDTFVVYTDNETYAGRMHPSQALTKYREQTGIPAKLIVVGMVSNEFSIADPKDPGMLDVVGFNTQTPAVMAEFTRG